MSKDDKELIIELRDEIVDTSSKQRIRTAQVKADFGVALRRIQDFTAHFNAFKTSPKGIQDVM